MLLFCLLFIPFVYFHSIDCAASDKTSCIFFWFQYTEQLIPCVIITPLDCFYEGSYIVSPVPDKRFSYRKNSPKKLLEKMIGAFFHYEKTYEDAKEFLKKVSMNLFSHSLQGIIYIIRAQNFPKKANISYPPPHTQSYVRNIRRKETLNFAHVSNEWFPNRAFNLTNSIMHASKFTNIGRQFHMRPKIKFWTVQTQGYFTHSSE